MKERDVRDLCAAFNKAQARGPAAVARFKAILNAASPAILAGENPEAALIELWIDADDKPGKRAN